MTKKTDGQNDEKDGIGGPTETEKNAKIYTFVYMYVFRNERRTPFILFLCVRVRVRFRISALFLLEDSRTRGLEASRP